MTSAPVDPSRRAFLAGTGAAVLASALHDVARPAPAASSAPPQPLAGLSATAAVGHLSRGDITVEEYARALLAGCHAAAGLNAFITLEPERVLEQARASDLARRSGAQPGLLFGLPVPVKDSVNTREYPTTAGTPALRHFHPAQDAPVVGALKAAGAIVLGKTNLHELSYGWTSNNLAFGAVRNPYDPSCIPGGSSGGTAAAIAARLAPLGVAEDTEGSIRVPAAFCGVQGFRPTTGRYSTHACVPITPLFDQVGPLARCVADLALFDAVVSGDRRGLVARPLAGVRLGVVRDYWFTDLDPEIEHLTELALTRLRDAGVVLVEGRLPDLARVIASTTLQVQNHDVLPALAAYLAEFHAGVTVAELIADASPDIRELFRSDVLPGGANVVSDSVYATARNQDLPALRKLFRSYFRASGVAALVLPVTLIPPPRIGAEDPVNIRGHAVPFDVALSRNIAPGSTAALPGLVLPIGLTAAGLPAALEFDAPSGADRTLLSLGLSLERVLGALPAPPSRKVA